ncbi:MAG: Ig-like domain-containing protein [Nocardioides sp.]
MSATRSRVTLVAVGLGLGALVLAACDTAATDGAAPAQGSGHTPRSSLSNSPTPAPPKAEIRTNVPAKGVPVDKVVEVSGSHAKMSSVKVSSSAGELPGRLSTAKNTWTASALLEPGTSYTVRSTVRTDSGRTLQRTAAFRTQDLTLDQQTYPSVAPLNGETVGVGMPVIVTFDVPVTDRAAIEKHMRVTASSGQPGSWHWLSDQEVHWRPRTYWKAGTDVAVDVDVNSVPAGNGIFGQLDRHVEFHVGDAHISQVNAQTDQMQVFSNGQLLRTVPITAGKPGFTTRSGVKVIIEKFRHKRMNSETIGIDPNGPEGYNIGNVQYAMRVTYSGEFVHAAPWSVASQGHANVSHGCTGMSLANAKWLYHMTMRGDVVEFTGTNRQMTLTNGYGDWNEPFSTWRSGSALS